MYKSWLKVESKLTSTIFQSIFSKSCICLRSTDFEFVDDIVLGGYIEWEDLFDAWLW
jgi:hypothetical protein